MVRPARMPSPPPSPCRGHGLWRGVTKFRLRDWGISRQRYWGCRSRWCIAPPAASSRRKENLPVRLPEDVSFDRPGNPLERHPTWRATLPPAGTRRGRETDTMDTFVDSSWYYARFTAPTPRPRPCARTPITG